jgi:glycosyltransferase involved in cell wall biosynthesis
MKEPLVSVAMITFNHAPYISQAIEGILQQKTDFPFELVIGEDCSTDGTREIVFDYQKKYPEVIRVVTSDQNVGVVKNAYRTEKACRGKYIAYKLQKQADYMECHPECSMVHSDCDCYYTATGRRIQSIHKYDRRRMLDDPDICDMLTRKCGVMTCTVSVRRNLLNRIIDSDPVLYQSGRFLMGDTPRWAEMSRLGKVGYINESLATYNVHDESISRSRDAVKVLNFFKSAREMIFYILDKYNLPAASRNRCRKYWCASALKTAFYEKHAQLGQEVKRVKGRFTAKEWLQFWGSQSAFWNFIFRTTVYLYKFPLRLVRWMRNVV